EAGQTFVDFLTDYRLSAAVYYLKETRDEIGVVAENCGFVNLSYFIRSFHRKYGASPGRYRKQSRLGKDDAMASKEE
ncbi:MAG: helix-turn-helix transcriptional regulator, partial [Oscillospiraceae bacterium]|nr:helix-turn-helix transcriptional regulator [Oscillospiraceae bacterium]